MSGNKISLESLTSPSPPKAFQGFLFLCKGWAMFPRISHSGHSGEPCSPTMGSGCGGADILWGTDSCVIKPHFSVTLFVKHRKDERWSWCPCVTHNANVDTLTVSAVTCSCDGPNSARNSRKIRTYRIYAFLLKGWGEGRLFTFGEIFIGPFPTVSVWF